MAECVEKLSEVYIERLRAEVEAELAKLGVGFVEPVVAEGD